jgi:septal ring factor EnvC (AmiA/AmiB activator)
MTAPHEALPPDAPATVEDVRVARRWTWVAFAWAIAASAIAILALIRAGNDSSDNAPVQPTQDLAGQIRRFEHQTNDRLDAFNRRLGDAAAGSDLRKLDRRLATVEDDLSKVQTTSSDQADTIKKLQTQVSDLDGRVSKLEQQQSQNQGQGQTTP